MRREMVVIRDPLRELREHGRGTAEICARHVITTEGVMKRFRDPVRLGTAHRRRDRDEPELLDGDHRLAVYPGDESGA